MYGVRLSRKWCSVATSEESMRGCLVTFLTIHIRLLSLECKLRVYDVIEFLLQDCCVNNTQKGFE